VGDLSERSRAAAWRWLPWLALGLFCLYAGASFWTRSDAAFAGKLSSDNVVSMWFYDVVSRSLADGALPTHMRDLNHPAPWPRTKEFPAVMDAVLVAPLGWLFDYPRQWNASLGLAVLVNGLGTALLARGAGARGVGLVVAGCLGALCRPVWKDFVMARMNAVWIGLPAGALGLALLAVDVETPGLRSALRRLPLAAGAAILGALAAAVYPPYLLLFAPAAVMLAAGPLWRSRGWGLLPLTVALALGAALAWPELSAILDGRQGDMGRETCPDNYGALASDALWRTTPSAFQGLSLPGTAAWGWVLAPLVLLHPRRATGVLLGGMTALWVLMSLGPCPKDLSGVPLHPEAWPVIGAVLPHLWEAGAPLHDFGRFAGVAVVQAALLGALGLEAIAGERRLGRSLLALAMGAAAVGHVQYYILSEAMDTRKWHAVQASPVATDLAEAGTAAFPAVELPFDRKQQFLSAIQTPGPRINPLRPGDPAPVPQPFVEWLMAVGRGDLTQPTPSLAQARASGIRRVYLDTGRCNGGGVKRQACAPPVADAMTSVLGTASPIAPGVWVWVIESDD